MKLEEFPFLEPDKADAYLTSLALNRELVMEALAWLQRSRWRPVARSAGKLQEEGASYDLLRSIDLEVDDTNFMVDGQEYKDLRFHPPSADVKAELRAVIREYAPQFDPTYHNLDFLRAEIARMTGLEFNKATFESVAKQADIPVQWFSPGRKRGLPPAKNSNQSRGDS